MIRATVTNVSYEPRTADASCEVCDWNIGGPDGYCRRLARGHTGQTGHHTVVYTVQRADYTRETIGA